jgi:hypothetical protein
MTNLTVEAETGGGEVCVTGSGKGPGVSWAFLEISTGALVCPGADFSGTVD